MKSSSIINLTLSFQARKSLYCYFPLELPFFSPKQKIINDLDHFISFKKVLIGQLAEE